MVGHRYCDKNLRGIVFEDKNLHQASDCELRGQTLSARRAHVALRSDTVSHGGMGSLFGARWRQLSGCLMEERLHAK